MNRPLSELALPEKIDGFESSFQGQQGWPGRNDETNLNKLAEELRGSWVQKDGFSGQMEFRKRSNLVLCGFKGVGKSHFGKLLAERIGKPFIDTDRLLEERFSQSCSRLMKTFGKNAFLSFEAEVISSLQGVQNSIIALGGGTLLHPLNATQVLKMGKLIYLSIDKESVKKRLLKDPLPAFVDPHDPDGSFEKMYLEREPLYEKLCTVKLNLEHATEIEILEQLTSYANHLTNVKKTSGTE